MSPCSTGLPSIQPGNMARIFKKFACKALKGRGVQSGIRVIYAYFVKEDRVEFIEIYFKGDKASEDRHRIAGIYPRGGPGR